MDSVEPWRKALQDSGLGDAEVAERIRILGEFCELAELDPDGVVEACVDRDRGRIVAGERKKVESLIDEFAADGDPRTATRRANVVRSFLIHNGVRVLAPKAPWL
ncbi:MAG: hypothetical protein U0U69_06220 [Acidimicrobiia bacterium]